MPNKGPILICEDDQDDREVLIEAFQSLGIANEIKFFKECSSALDYLKSTTDNPFIIISDINMPGMSGNDLKREINKNEYLRKKSIPFIFLSTTADSFAIEEAYNLMVQGYFQKANNFNEIKATLKQIVDYWTLSKRPKKN
jgi:CheY-like chemotaxis protein